MLLSYTEICELIEAGVIEGATMDAVNSSSLDIHLGDTLLYEQLHIDTVVVDYRKREPVSTLSVPLAGDGALLAPGAFGLAHSREVFHLPRHVSGEYKLKSSMARIGLEHLNAGWCDAGWNGSCLTLEFKNMTRSHWIRLREGDPIGQIVFFRHTEVPVSRDYGSRGRYNGDRTVSGIKP